MQLPGMKGARGFAWGQEAAQSRCFSQDMHSPASPQEHPAQTFPCFSIKSRYCRVPHSTSAPSPAQHGGGPGAGLVLPGSVEVLLNYAEFWGRGVYVTSFFPQRPP